MIPTITFMKQSFRRFNQEYFQGSLPTPGFKISRSAKSLGYFRWIGNTLSDGTIEYTYFIACSKYYDRPVEEVENTMLHEMCHLWVFINYPNTTDPPHGPIWRSIANRITKASNNKYIITVLTFPGYNINPQMLRSSKKASRPPRKRRTTYQPSFRRTLLRTLFLLMLLVLFL